MIYKKCSLGQEIAKVKQINEQNSTVNYIRFNNNGFFGTNNIPPSETHQSLNNQCGGFFKNIQNLIETPKINIDRPICNLRCEYQIMSPYVCENEFHVQFLNFSLESSEDCLNERLVINHDEIFCGRQIESRKFKTKAGVLNITFSSKSFNYREGRGFKILVTRLPCIDSIDSEQLESTDADINIITTTDDPKCLKVNSTVTFSDHNSSTYGIHGFNRTVNSRQDIPPPTLPPIGPPITILPTPPAFLKCCQNIYNQNRFLLISQGFPAFIVGENDCLFVIQKSSPNVCRLRIIFKYFNLQDRMANELGGCNNNFLEIEGRRLCGCKSEFVFETFWGYEASKILRLRTSPGQHVSAQGFVLEVIQEDCPSKLNEQDAHIRQKRFINFFNNFPHFQPRVKQINNPFVSNNENFVSKFYQPRNENIIDNGCILNHYKLYKLKFEFLTLAMTKHFCRR